MMNVAEGFTNIVVSKGTEEEKNELMVLYAVGLTIKLALLYIVYRFLWPYVVPKLTKNVTPNPKFTTILALYLLISFLF